MAGKGTIHFVLEMKQLASKRSDDNKIHRKATITRKLTCEQSSGFLNWGLASAVFRGLNLTKQCNAQKIPKFLIPKLTKPCNAQKIPKIPKFWHLCPGQDPFPENFGIL